MTYINPQCSVDLTIFSIQDTVIDSQSALKLHVLLVKRAKPEGDDSYPYAGEWSLPGAIMDEAKGYDSYEDACYDTIRAKTGINFPYLEQVGGVYSRTRDPRGPSTTMLYYTLLPSKEYLGARMNLFPGEQVLEAKWAPVTSGEVKESLAFDHGILLKQAFHRVQEKSRYSTVPLHFLPKEFTWTNCREVFEVMLERSFAPKQVKARINSAEIVKSLNRMMETGGKPAALFSLVDDYKDHYFQRNFDI